MRKFLLAPVAAACLLGGATSAFAWEEFNIGPGMTPSTYLSVGITATGITDISTSSKSVTSGSYLAGQFRVDVAATNSSHAGTPGSLLNGSSFYTYCVELTEHLASPTTAPMDYNVVASTAQVTSAKLATLAQLFTHGAPPVLAGSLSNGKGAAFQAAVWEVVYETASGPYDLSSGNMKFAAAGVTVADLAWAQSLLSAGAVTPLYSLQVLHSANPLDSTVSKQDYLVITAVPEPEAYGLALAGLGVVALGMRRRRKA